MVTHFQLAMNYGNAAFVALTDLRAKHLARGDKYRPRPSARNLLTELVYLYGWVGLGSGAYGCVIAPAENPDIVVKFGVIDDEDAVSDIWRDGYIDYAVFCRDNYTRSKHLPKIYEIAVFDRMFCVIMERLDIMDTGLRCGPEWDTKCLIRSAIGYPTDPAIGISLDFESDRVFSDLKRSLGCSDDAHCGNFLLRGDTVVLTDPYAGKTKAPNHREYMEGQRIVSRRTPLVEDRPLVTSGPVP